MTQDNMMTLEDITSTSPYNAFDIVCTGNTGIIINGVILYFRN